MVNDDKKLDNQEDQEDELIIVENKADLVDDHQDDDDDDDNDNEDRKKVTDKALKEADDDDKEAEDDVLARRRQERKERKERKQKAIDRDKKELEFHRTRNADLERRLSTVESKNHESTLAQIDQALIKAQNDIKTAERIMEKAVAASNGADLVKATNIRDQARDYVQRLTHAKQQATQQSQKPSNAGLDDESARHARKFLKEHPWYDPQKGGEDSAIVLAIDSSIVADGFDSKTEEYWDELRARIKRRLPEKFKGGDKADLDDDEPAPPRKAAGGPALGSGRNTATTAKTFYISPDRKQAMIDAGVWEDPVLRKRMVRQYEKYDKEQKAAK